MIHSLKTWQPYFSDLVLGKKNFEVRKNDRDFQVGDVLHLLEWNPLTKEYTKDNVIREVTYILEGGNFGIELGYVVMGLRELIYQ
jgi:hypothetical protein